MPMFTIGLADADAYFICPQWKGLLALPIIDAYLGCQSNTDTVHDL